MNLFDNLDDDILNFELEYNREKFLTRDEKLATIKQKLRPYYESEEEFNELFQIVDSTEKAAEKVLEKFKDLKMNYDKFIDQYFDPNDKMGFNEVLFARQEKLNALRHRLGKYLLTENELDELFKIIIDAEIAMEKIKRKFNGKDYTTVDMLKLERGLAEIRLKMKQNFENKLSFIIKAKYAKAKKIKEELDKKNKM